LEDVCERLESLQLVWNLFLARPLEGHVHWVETTDRNVTFYDTPLQIGNELREKINESDCSWIFTSATLAVENNFTYFTDQMGIADAETRRWSSPFDFRKNSLLYVPNILSEPREKKYDTDFVNAILPVLSASDGRAFVLFTSYRAMQSVGAILGTVSDYPLFIQGDASKSELIESFKKTANAVLLGTSSFWEGIDVRGDQLSCVIIDKLPFAVPDDPVLVARSRLITSLGRNAFIDFQVPHAVNSLKQGAGRLIRDASDRGVLVIADKRILTKSYGKYFLKSLPPIPLTRELDDVEKFFAFRARS
jgi:ATP-dependent DNA helicase DinG